MRLSKKVGLGFVTVGFASALLGRLLLTDEQFGLFERIVFPILIVGV
jgi:hypothetical protein